MRLRETARSIRQAFGAIGMFCIGLAVLGLLEPPGPRWFEWPLRLAEVAIGIGYVAAAITLPAALRTSPTWILRLLLISRWLFSLHAVVSGLFGEPGVRGSALAGVPMAFAMTEHMQREVIRLWIEQRQVEHDLN